MKAVINGTVIAEAPKEDLISIEGNWYFPPSSIQEEFFQETPTAYTCPWKGEAQYFAVKDPSTGSGQEAQWLQDRAWSYPTPYPASFDRVGKDYSGYVAFWKEVKVTD